VSGLASKPLRRFLIVCASNPMATVCEWFDLKTTPTVFTDLASKPVAMIFSSLTSKLAATVSSDMASKPVAAVSHGFASKPAVTVSSASPQFAHGPNHHSCGFGP
jgi:hypothetical protein